jgi:hypothetical protein
MIYNIFPRSEEQAVYLFIQHAKEYYRSRDARGAMTYLTVRRSLERIAWKVAI